MVQRVNEVDGLSSEVHVHAGKVQVFPVTVTIGRGQRVDSRSLRLQFSEFRLTRRKSGASLCFAFSISVRLRQRRGSNPLETRSMFEYVAAQHLLQKLMRQRPFVRPHQRDGRGDRSAACRNNYPVRRARETRRERNGKVPTRPTHIRPPRPQQYQPQPHLTLYRLLRLLSGGHTFLREPIEDSCESIACS
jgi:hypothetical protein